MWWVDSAEVELVCKDFQASKGDETEDVFALTGSPSPVARRPARAEDLLLNVEQVVPERVHSVVSGANVRLTTVDNY